MKKNKENIIELPEGADEFFVEKDISDVKNADAEYETAVTEQNVYFTDDISDNIGDLQLEGEKEMANKKNTFAFLKNKAFIISASIVLAVIIAFTVVWCVLSNIWKSGKAVMPAFLANAGLYQGRGFEFCDGVSINNVDVSGLSLKKAKQKVDKALAKEKADYNIVIKAGEDSVTLVKSDFTYELDGDSVLKEAKAYSIDVMTGKQKRVKTNFNAPVKFTQKCEEGIKNKVNEKLHKDAVDAELEGFSAGKVLFKDDIDGYKVDETDLMTSINNFITEGKTSGTINVKTVAVKAAVTKAELETKITKLSTFSTVSSNSAEGNHNMRKALNMCNGSVIMPGEVWSFNACTGNSNVAASGWKESVVYIGGKQDYGVGGGICQSSTTIYNAALYANLGIAERHCHAWASGYVAIGLDATIDYPGLDLKLKNNTEYPIYLECYMNGVTLTANFYGYHTEDYDKITLSSYETSRVEGEYYTVAASRSLWLDGKLVKTERLTASRYSLKPKTWVSDEESSSETEDPSVSPDPDPSEDPSVSPDPDPSEDPSVSPDPDPSVSPDPDPSEDPSVSPEPNPSDDPSLTSDVS